MSTAVLNPSPVPDVGHHKRKRSLSREADGGPPPSRRRSHSPAPPPIDLPRVQDADPVRRIERERQLAARMAAIELEKAEKPEKPKNINDNFDSKAEFAKLIGSRSGGVYVPPARLRAMQEAAASNKASPEYQRLSWDALRKSITGIVNRVNVQNIKQVVPELFSENLIRGRGLFARSIMKAQAASLPFTPVFAALVAIVNTKLPQVGELVLTRLISQFRRAFKRNDKIVCNSTTTFIAHLVNQAVAHEIIALQILVLLLERPTDDSIEIAVGFTREVGAFLAENSPKANATVFERFRAVLNEGSISQRVQYMIEVLMQVRKDKYKDNPILPEGLDLVEEEEQITHQIQLEEELQVQEGLNIFKFDSNFLENEEKYKAIKTEILGEDSDEESGSEESSEESDEDEVVEDKEGIEDRTGTNLVNLRRVIYLTIMNALNYEEAVHKLLKVQLKEGEEIELINMLIECCSQERSYSKFYGLIGERFSKLNRVWTDCLEEAFQSYYETIHRYETNRLRNIAKFFGYLFSSDSITWTAMRSIRINEDDTTSSSRIFVKIMMNEIMESMGLKELAERFKDPEIKIACEGMFPMDVPKNTRFAINYFTSIGLGALTEEMREYLKNAPRLIMEQRRAMLEDTTSSDSDSSDSDSESDSDSDSDSSSASDSTDTRSGRGSRSPRRRRSYTPPSRARGSRRDNSRSPSPPRRRGRADSRSPPPPPRRARDDSRSPPRKITDDRSPPRGKYGRIDRSDSPPPRRGRNDRSPSPPPRRGRDDRSPIPPPRRGERDGSRTPPRRAGRYDSPSRSRSPPPRNVDSRRDLPPHKSYGRDASPGRNRRSGRPLHSPSPPPRGRRDGGRSRSRTSAGGVRNRDVRMASRSRTPPGKGRRSDSVDRRDDRGRRASPPRYDDDRRDRYNRDGRDRSRR